MSPEVIQQPTKKPLTKMEYDDFLSEIQSVTGKLTHTRSNLWTTQDQLKASAERIERLENHIAELVASRDKDARVIRGLQEENSRSLEVEATIRESLDLMKKVFTRTQLKSKEEQETTALLQEERDLLLEENQKLRSSIPKDGKLNAAADEARRNASVLASSLEQTRAELAEYKKKLLTAEKTIQKLKAKLAEDTNPQSNDVERRLQKQSRHINRLESQLRELVDGEARGDREIRDNPEKHVVERALFDEDLNDGLAREFISKLTCDSFNEIMMKKRELDCASFNDNLAANAYPYLGFGDRPHGSL